MTTQYTGSLNGNTVDGTLEGSGFWEHPEAGSGTWPWSGNVEIIIDAYEPEPIPTVIPDPSVIPEPTTLILFGLGLLGVC
jgi:hypothetical protein